LLAGAGGVTRLALANLLRRPLVAVAQVAGLSLGLMAMLLLGTVRNDLLNDWQASLPADAPNRFVINIQSQQLDTLRAFFAQEQQAPPVLLPMVRGRLVEINGKPLEAKDYLDERARRLAEREFNLSWAAQMPPDNRLVAGRWWPPPYGEKLLSLEQGIAETLGIKLGDALTYDIGGRRLRLTVSSLRKVEWDSMRANFFAMTPPGVLEDFPASYITSFYLPIGQEELLNRLLKRLPNLTVIDVAALLAQVRGLLDRMALAVQFVFGFCLLAGMAVLYAALAASRDERAGETALLRVLGARRSQIRLAVLAEFAGIGLLSGAAAVTGASLLAWAVSAWLLHIPHGFNSSLALTALAVGGLLVPLAAWMGLRRVVSCEPKRVLNRF
jgi:putative ABC transport system permease protein